MFKSVCQVEVVYIGILCVLDTGSVRILHCKFCFAVSSFFFNTVGGYMIVSGFGIPILKDNIFSNGMIINHSVATSNQYS